MLLLQKSTPLSILLLKLKQNLAFPHFPNKNPKTTQKTNKFIKLSL